MAQPLQGAMWKQLLQRSARENLTLQGQIREMLVSAILDGQLKPDTTDRHFNHMRPSIAPQNSLRTTGISSQSHSGALVGSAAAKKVLCRRMISIAPGAPDTGTPRRAPASPLWPVTS